MHGLTSAVKLYDASGTRSRHQKLLRGYLHIRPAEANTLKWLEALATDAAHTKVELPDIVNVLIEELIRVRCELRKVIKYNQLVANMVILHNVQWMSRKLKDLQERGHPVNAEVLKALSPYRREHVNRFGNYLLNLQRRVPPLDPSIDFLFKSAA
ncbi:Tn3 family transposase [Cupriavidus basilensis]|uniref:Tn3 family transposase n=1 Tax=Cupriavidus basilensis TaxID=68895 RepID=A0ABT6B408_9BURK|nr:Tn3 family transposase [Cupriavidus basilensis]MDF3839615.1 Tn3 family transposase [Cupriavidus basilensis]